MHVTRSPAGGLIDLCLVHVHVPRTGGTMLREVLFERLAPQLAADQIFLVGLGSDVFRTGSAGDLYGLSDPEVRRLRFITGHAPLQFANHVRRPFPFTVLREPIDRALSAYFYCYNTVHHPAHALARNLSPAEFVTGGWGETCNGQARYLSGCFFDGQNPSDDDLLEAAEHALDRLSYVGFFDDLGGTANDLCTIVGAPAPLHLSRVNAAQRCSITEGELAAITEANAVDVALYETARARWRRDSAS